MSLENIKKLNIPKSPGVYRFFDKNNKIIYIGKAADLRARVLSYWRKSAGHSSAKHSMMKKIEKVEWIETESEIEALLLEANLIKKIQPQYNVALRDDKRFAYIKVSVDDEIPGVFFTRKIGKSGKYFGPFTGAEAAKQTLKAIRKIWPYCAARKRQSKPCFYYQINRCLGVCGGIVGKKEYMEKVIKPIVLFLEGKKGKVIKNYESRIRNYEKELEKHPAKRTSLGGGKTHKTENRDEIQEEINLLKFQLLNIKRVLEHTKILSVADKYANDVVELAKILGLPKVPRRIESYDISNLFGREAVGAMAVFDGGEADKSEYRKFKIRTAQGKANDAKMLREILERRFSRGKNEREGKKIDNQKLTIKNSEWALPDLIIVDGGKAQLNAASRVLKKLKLDIPVIAVSKGLGSRAASAPDKLFFPKEKKPLELPLSSPALHLIKRARDEAHRFAVGYHRRLRKKRMF